MQEPTAILRVDKYLRDHGGIDVQDIVTVKCIVDGVEEAEAEVERLNLLMQEQGDADHIVYFWQRTRFR